jgi:hypothetical protein
MCILSSRGVVGTQESCVVGISEKLNGQLLLNVSCWLKSEINASNVSLANSTYFDIAKKFCRKTLDI